MQDRADGDRSKARADGWGFHDMKVLLTGGAGFIGQHVLRELLARGHEVRVMDPLRADVHAGRTWTPPAGVELQTADVRDAAAVDRALGGVEAVLHLAAKVGLGVAVSDLPDYASSEPPSCWPAWRAPASAGSRSRARWSSMARASGIAASMAR